MEDDYLQMRGRKFLFSQSSLLTTLWANNCTEHLANDSVVEAGVPPLKDHILVAVGNEEASDSLIQNSLLGEKGPHGDTAEEGESGAEMFVLLFEFIHSSDC